MIGLQHDGGAILTAMDAEAIKHLAGICQLLGVVLVLQEVLAFARFGANWQERSPAARPMDVGGSGATAAAAAPVAGGLR